MPTSCRSMLPWHRTSYAASILWPRSTSTAALPTATARTHTTDPASRMGSGRQLDDDAAGVTTKVDILAMLAASSSEAGKPAAAAKPVPVKTPPPGFETKVASNPPIADGDDGEKKKSQRKQSAPKDGTPNRNPRGGRGNDSTESGKRGNGNSNDNGKSLRVFGGKSLRGDRKDAEMNTKDLLDMQKSLPRRQLWVVRVPSPKEDDDTDVQIQLKETRVLRLTAQIDDAMAKLAAAKLVRDEARDAIAPVREQLREVNDELREKQAIMKPLLDIVQASNARANEVRRMGKDLKGVSTAEALREKLDGLEHEMSHTVLTVLQQKAVLREIKQLRGKKGDIAQLQGKRLAIEANEFDRESAAARLKLMRSLCDFIKVKQVEVTKLFDHYKQVADAADAQAQAANEKRQDAANERRGLGNELRHLRKLGARDRGEFYRSRRVVSKARELVKKGDTAEAESLCVEQMEHVHARLAMDAGYRLQYVEGLRRTKEERAVTKGAAEAASATAEASAARVRSLETAAAAASAAKAAKEREHELATAAKAAAKSAEAEMKRVALETQAADTKQKADAKTHAKASKIATAPVLEPGVLQLAWMAREEVGGRREVAAVEPETSTVAPEDTAPAEDAAAAEAKRKKRWEKKARKKQARKEKHDGDVASGSGSGSGSGGVDSEPISFATEDEPVVKTSEPEPTRVDELSVQESIAEPDELAEEAPENAVFAQEKEIVDAFQVEEDGYSHMTHQRNAGAFGLTETQRGWVVGAVVLVTVAVCLMASGYRLELVRA